jgi:hypothetical protein
MATASSSRTNNSPFAELEKDLETALEQDRRYQLENEVKTRAITQVSNYDEFQ